MATSTGSAPGVRTHFKTPEGRYNLSRDKVHPSAIPHYSLAAKVISQVTLAHLKEKPTQSSSASSGISSTPGGVRFTARLLGAGNGSRSLGFGGNGFTGRLSASSKSPTVSNAGGAVGLSNGPLTSSYDGEGTYLIFNVGDAIFISDYYSQVKEPIKAIQFSNANPVCHHFDDDTKDSNDLLIGLSTGDVYSASLRQQLQDSGKKLVGAVHFNKDGSINSSRCTAVSHVPNVEGIFVAAHADGNILVYDKTKDGSGDAPFPPVKDVAQFHVAHARSSKINGRDRTNEIRKFIDGSHSNIQEEMSVSVDREDDELTKYYDFLVIGSGIAGLRYALEVAKYGSVVILTKSEPHESNTVYAQGGVSAVLDPTDSVESHIRDTIVAGAFLCDEETVEVVCREGPERVKELIAWGALFDKSEDGQLHLAREGGHSHHRIVHAADMTGREIERALLTSVSQNPDIVIFKHHVAVDLLTLQDEENVVCYGVDALDIQSAKVVRFLAGVTMLASGGAGHVYPTTTNPLVATGDGVALAQRSRAVVSNMEFVQFHPTALADEGLPIKPAKRDNAFLITEAVRGAGGILYNQSMERFMPSYDSRAELAPRDVVARSIDDQLKKRDERFVYLDISHNSAKEIMAHFPNIAAECSKYGLDITKQPIPVVPAAHYMCGGVQTGLKGETSIKGLFAAGEVTCTGLHGANRLASNSLLEALVFAERAVEPSVAYALQSNVGRAEVKQAKKWPRPLAPSAAKHLKMDEILRITSLKRKRLQQVMWDYVGIVRSTERLKRAQAELRELECEWEAQLLRNGWTPIMVSLEVCEMRNLISVAYLIVNSALTRQESRGLHFTTSFPQLVESERFPTILFPTNPVTNSWSSQVVHRLAIESQ